MYKYATRLSIETVSEIASEALEHGLSSPLTEEITYFSTNSASNSVEGMMSHDILVAFRAG